MTRGFPRADAPVREWIPGVSTPEGLLLGTAAAVVLVAGQPALFERLVMMTATGVMVTVTTAVPAGAVWFGAHLGNL